jgi:uncharacterized protein YoxC
MRLGEIEKNVGAIQNQGTAQADIADSLDRINNRLLQLEGRVDESAHSSSSIQQNSKQLQQDIQSRMNTLSDQVMILSQKVDALDAQYNAVLGNVSEIQANSQQNVAALNEMRQVRAREAADRALAASRAAEEAKLRTQQQQYSDQKPEIVPVQVKKKPDEAEATPVAVAPTVEKTLMQKQESQAEILVSGSEKAQYDAAYEQFKAKQYKKHIILSPISSRNIPKAAWPPMHVSGSEIPFTTRTNSN